MANLSLLSTAYRLFSQTRIILGSSALFLPRSLSNLANETYPLSKTEAVSYLEQTLKITKWQSLLRENPLSFLRLMLTQTKLCAPYTNLTFFSKDGIKNLTLEEGKDFMFTKQGGNCFIINPFIEAVLRRLGLQTYCVPASIFHWGSVRFFGHVGIVIRNLTQTDQLYVLDPGNPYLTTEAVPIDFDRSSPSYGTPIFCYKYFMVSPGFVHMCKRVDLSDITKLTDRCHFFVEDDQYWKVLYTYNIFEPQSAPYFVKVNQTFCDNASAFPELHYDLLLLGYPDGVMVNITRQQCLTVDKHGKTHVTKITDTSQLVTTIRRYFPQYSVERIEVAMKNFENKN